MEDKIMTEDRSLNATSISSNVLDATLKTPFADMFQLFLVNLSYYLIYLQVHIDNYQQPSSLAGGYLECCGGAEDLEGVQLSPYLCMSGKSTTYGAEENYVSKKLSFLDFWQFLLLNPDAQHSTRGLLASTETTHRPGSPGFLCCSVASNDLALLQDDSVEI
ncbi:hypothetical protein BDR05DRAFT_946971 [Suillus weaverae]|nr:hypothetical protein BDR05DRAFT_946971 [Suillus weaverae]